MARIAVVNEYPDFLDLMTSILDEMAGHEVSGFDSSEITVDGLVANRPDLLVVDLHTADGVLTQIDGMLDDGSAAALSLVPIIVCSGDIPALRSWADECRDLGNMYSLEKPFTVDTLIDVVERALHKAGATARRLKASRSQTHCCLTSTGRRFSRKTQGPHLADPERAVAGKGKR